MIPTFQVQGFGALLVLTWFRVIIHFPANGKAFQFMPLAFASWAGITSGIIFQSVVIPLVVHPSEAVQEGFDVRFYFIRRIRLRRRLRFLCCRLRSSDQEPLQAVGERFPDRCLDLFQ